MRLSIDGCLWEPLDTQWSEKKVSGTYLLLADAFAIFSSIHCIVVAVRRDKLVSVCSCHIIRELRCASELSHGDHSLTRLQSLDVNAFVSVVSDYRRSRRRRMNYDLRLNVHHARSGEDPFNIAHPQVRSSLPLAAA